MYHILVVVLPDATAEIAAIELRNEAIGHQGEACSLRVQVQAGLGSCHLPVDDGIHRWAAWMAIRLETAAVVADWDNRSSVVSALLMQV